MTSVKIGIIISLVPNHEVKRVEEKEAVERRKMVDAAINRLLQDLTWPKAVMLLGILLATLGGLSVSADILTAGMLIVAVGGFWGFAETMYKDEKEKEIRKLESKTKDKSNDAH